LSTAVLASASRCCASCCASIRCFCASASAAFASPFIRSASASCALIFSSRSTVALRICGQANFHNRRTRIPKTIRDQKKRPKLTSKGPGDDPPSAAASCNANRIPMLMSNLCDQPFSPLPATRYRFLLDQLEQQREDHGDDRRTLEQHREEQRRTADLA